MTPESNEIEKYSDSSSGRLRGGPRLCKRPKVTFADVAGLDEAKAEISGFVEFLKDPSRYGRLGASIPKGVLLTGPPGTGKTLLAHAIAGELEAPLYVVTSAECAEIANVCGPGLQGLFDEARAQAPAVIFIDGLDVLARADNPGRLGDSTRKEPALHQFLTALDEFDPRPGVLLLAATNRPDLLDPALLRSGRFDRQILIERPDRAARLAILALHLRRIKAASDIDVERIASQTPGLTGADLARLVNEAALLATRRGASHVVSADIIEAIERVQAGFGRKPRVLSPEERETLAYHAMGRALVAMLLPGPDPISGISLMPLDSSRLTGTLPDPVEHQVAMCREELQARLAVLLAGRAAERLVFNRVSTAGTDALQRAINLARAMVTRHGMAEELLPVPLDHEPAAAEAAKEWPPGRYGEAMTEVIGRLVRERIKQALDQASYILKKRRQVLDTGARLLLEKETLTAETLRALAEEQTPAAA